MWVQVPPRAQREVKNMGMTETEKKELETLSLKRIEKSGINPNAIFQGTLRPDIAKKIRTVKDNKDK